MPPWTQRAGYYSMKILALDIGEKRTGVACGDTVSKTALPISTIDTREMLKSPQKLKAVAEEHQVEMLLVGLPVSLDGQENSQAERVRELADRIAQILVLPLVFQDERLSSAEAKRFLREAGYTERQMRGKIDMIAASLVLQTYLDLAQGEGRGMAQL